MKKYKINTPSDSFGGKRHGIQFYRGEAVAELTEDLVSEMESWGYIVEEIAEKKAPQRQKKTADK